MPNSNVLCKHIHKTGCPYYLDGLLCPDDCKGFESIEIAKPVTQMETIVFNKKEVK